MITLENISRSQRLEKIKSIKNENKQKVAQMAK